MLVPFLVAAAVADDAMMLPTWTGCVLFAPEPAVVQQPPVGRTWPKRVYETIPLVRSVQDVIALTPGVVASRSGLRIAGSPSSEIGWFVDGVNLTDPVGGGFGPSPAGPALPPLRVRPPG